MMSHQKQIRNVAVIAHVDHGKTTLVDQLLYQSGMFRDKELDRLSGGQHGLIMDSNPLERERGITILSKNCAIDFMDKNGAVYRINIIDTPGHSDFGGEVERVLKMADGVLLLVDAFEGPMPQTRFVLSKALSHKLKPVVVVNKADRPDARADDVVNEVFDLFVSLNADSDALDFPVVFASAREGWATTDLERPGSSILPVFETIIHHIPAPSADAQAPLQMLVTSIDYCDYVGKIAIGRIVAGTVSQGKTVTVIDNDGRPFRQKITELYRYQGLGRKPVQRCDAGDICAVAGLDPVNIGNTVACAETPVALPVVAVDEPTMNMTFRINDGPFSGREGIYVTSRQIRERLDRELKSNVALRVENGQTADEFVVSGRGLLHLGILLENMRREGFELTVGKPRVIIKQTGDALYEPIERLVIDCPGDCLSSVISLLGDRQSEMIGMDSKSGADNYLQIHFSIPSRGLFGLHSRLMTATQGRAVMHHNFEKYEPVRGPMPQRQCGVMIAGNSGTATLYALDTLFDRGVFFIDPGEDVYEGQVVGEHCKDSDIGVNVVKTKQLTNMRAAGKDENARIKSPKKFSLEQALEYIQEDELVEITPKSLRLRKRLLKEPDRRRENRKNKVKQLQPLLNGRNDFSGINAVING